MANSPKITVAVANLMLDAGIGTLADLGKLRIYDSTGTGQPATPSTAVTTQVLLAECIMNADAFPAASAGVLTANAITADSDADAAGTATWFRLLKSDGTTALMDGSVGTSGCDVNLSSVSITLHGSVPVTSFTITHPVA